MLKQDENPHLFTYASANSSCAHPPPGQLRGICPPCHSRGWGISKFRATRGSGICLPRGYPRALNTLVVSTRNPNMEDFVGKDLQFVADWLVRQGLDRLVEFY